LTESPVGPRLILWPKRLLYLVAGAGILYAVGTVQMTWWMRLVAVVAPLAVMEGVLQLMLKGATRRFDQRLLSLLQAGETAGLLPLYKAQGLLRFAAPRHYTQGKLGLIHSKLGSHAEAADAYRQALDSAPEAKHYALALGLANSLFEIGEVAEAEEAFRSALDDEHINVQACAKLSRLIRARGGDLDEAERYLQTAVDVGRNGVLRCELVQLLLEQGLPEDASWQFSLAVEELGDDEVGAAALAKARAALEAAGVDPDAPVSPPATKEPATKEPEAKAEAEPVEPKSSD
jgi:tetratricopeptide (TPR) repeat protein